MCLGSYRDLRTREVYLDLLVVLNMSSMLYDEFWNFGCVFGCCSNWGELVAHGGGLGG